MCTRVRPRSRSGRRSTTARNSRCGRPSWRTTPGDPPQAQSPLDTRLIGAFDVPPYANSADQSGAVPFLDIANRYILAGAKVTRQVLAGLSVA